MQLYAAVLYNCYARGFIKGDIFKGDTKLACAPGLNCYSCPGAVFSCPLGALQNAIAGSNRRAPSYILGILLLYGLLLGRTVCGWLCPLGFIQELCHKLPTPKLKKSRVTCALSFFKYFILIALVLMIPRWFSYRSFAVPAFCKYLCPAGTLEGAIGLLSHPANRAELSILNVLFTNKFIFLIVFLFSSVFVFRAFCRFICPLGAIYSLFSKLAIIGVKVEKSACTDCGRCVSACKMDIRRVGDRECIHCGECIDLCPERAISFKAGKITLRANEGALSPEREKKRKNKRLLVGGAMLLILIALGVYVHLNDTSRVMERLSVKSATAAQEKAGSNEEIPSSDDRKTPGGENKAAAVYTVDESIPVGSDVGQRAKDFSVSLSGGGEFNLSACVGKPVVINFWGVWCGPCVAELPEFDRIYAEYGDEIAVVALHSNLLSGDMAAFLDEHDYAMPFAVDTGDNIRKSFDSSSVWPVTVVIDRYGVIRYNSTKSMTYEKLREQIKKVY